MTGLQVASHLAQQERTNAELQKSIRERERVEAALRDADRRKDEFLATLAHELRNPLAPIRNSLHILRLSMGSDQAAEQVCEMMERQVGHLVRLVDDLMEVSRITQGKLELRMEPVELAAFILGIGLSLVRMLVEMHRGHVDAHSEGMGQGSEFVVRLPLNKEGTISGREVSDPRASVLPNRRVLVVDDNRDAAESLGKLLQLLGAEVRVVNDGPPALATLPTYQPSVVLLDIGMPVMDGYEVARQIRAQPQWRDVMLIALTG